MGISTGLFGSGCVIFVREIAPDRIAGFVSAINLFMVTFGIMIISILGFAVPNKVGDENRSQYLVVKIILMGVIPALLSILQICLLLFVFKLESPVFYKEKNMNPRSADKNMELRSLECIYENPRKAMKLFNLPVNATVSIDTAYGYISNSDSNIIQGPRELYRLLAPPYRRAFLIGCVIAMMQQLTGANAVLFYSSEIFSRDGHGPNETKVGTMLIGVVNGISSFISIFILHFFDRKKLLYNGMIGIAI